MPLPGWLARANRAWVNRLANPFAEVLPWLCLLEHRGRTSGIVRRNPTTLFRHDDGRYVIALFYGADAQWVRNVLAAGGCRVKSRGRWITLADPRRSRDPSRRQLPWIVRPIARILRVDGILELHGR